MILRRYGKNVQSVELNFDSKALTDIGFRRDHEVSIEADGFLEGYEKLSEQSLTAEAEGDVQDEVESVMLDDLLVQLTALHGNLGEGEVLFVESERGQDYPKTRTRQTNIVVEGENPPPIQILM